MAFGSRVHRSFFHSLRRFEMKRLIFALCVALSVAVGAGISGERLKSGPQAGEAVPGPFHPLNVTGAYAGQKHCLYCECGPAPVAMIFAREVSPGLTKLIKKNDAKTPRNKRPPWAASSCSCRAMRNWATS